MTQTQLLAHLQSWHVKAAAAPTKTARRVASLVCLMIGAMLKGCYIGEAAEMPPSPNDVDLGKPSSG